MSEHAAESDATCPACGHVASCHWPEHGRLTTACAECFDESAYVETRPGAIGMCCYPARDIPPGGRRH